MLLGSLKPYAALAVTAALVAAFIATGGLAYKKGVKDAETAAQLLAANAELAVKDKWLERYNALATSAEDLRKKDAESAEQRAKANDLTNRRHTELLLSLQHRPSRIDTPSPGLPQASSAADSGATGAQLYREDGSFLAGEAARAQRQQSALRECYQKLDDYADSWAKAMKKSAP